jgi:hypothetical protein
MAAEVFTAGVVSGAFAAMAVFSTMIVFSVPVSMGTRGGGIGVIPIIGVIRTILITVLLPKLPRPMLRLRCVLRLLTREDEAPELVYEPVVIGKGTTLTFAPVLARFGRSALPQPSR